MRQAAIYYKDHLAGKLIEIDDGEYTFKYEEKYIKDHPKECITLTMPVSSKIYTDKRLFPFFEGLIPEGWLLDIASKNWKINQNDVPKMSRNTRCSKYTTGAEFFFFA